MTDVLNILWSVAVNKSQLYWASVCTHQAQQVEEQVCVFADQVVRLAAQVHEVVEAARRFVSSVYDICHVRGEDEGGTVPAGVTALLSWKRFVINTVINKLVTAHRPVQMV